jgi:hypothetical protein
MRQCDEADNRRPVTTKLGQCATTVSPMRTQRCITSARRLELCAASIANASVVRCLPRVFSRRFLLRKYPRHLARSIDSILIIRKA